MVISRSIKRLTNFSAKQIFPMFLSENHAKWVINNIKTMNLLFFLKKKQINSHVLTKRGQRGLTKRDFLCCKLCEYRTKTNSVEKDDEKRIKRR